MLQIPEVGRLTLTRFLLLKEIALSVSLGKSSNQPFELF